MRHPRRASQAAAAAEVQVRSSAPAPSAQLSLLSVKASPIAKYKLRASWSDGTYTDFGARGYSDYTIHKDINRRRLYQTRHARDRITEPKSAGALSWYLLWGESTALKTNITSFKRQFGL